MAERLSLSDAIIRHHVTAGTLPADIKLRSTHFDFEELYKGDEELDEALKCALGVVDDGLPDWAKPENPPPDAVRLFGDRKHTYCEPYYKLRNYRNTVFSDYVVKWSRNDPLAGQTKAWTRQVWMRVAAHIAPAVTDCVLRLENDERRDTSRQNIIRFVMDTSVYRGEALYEFMVDPGIDHDRVFHGVGKRAMNSLGAMLLPDNPDRGDVLLPYAEAHEEWLDKTFAGRYSRET